MQTAMRHARRILLAVLASSFLLRAYLAHAGGQYYWPDEARYQRSLAAVDALRAGDLRGFVNVLDRADHFLFKVIGVIPATIETFLWASPRVPALFFCLSSVASLWLLWGIVRRTGESARVALLAVGLLALCSTFLYYSRHLLPYDTALAFGLLAVFAGLRRPPRAADSMLCGVAALCAFMTYNGYWTLAVFALLTHTFVPDRTLAGCARRAVLSGSSFALPLAAANQDHPGEWRHSALRAVRPLRVSRGHSWAVDECPAD